tara:strand:- start:540 stop:779 length:240 start_codon:yes stop_codon:yes gene_type:complete
MATVSPLEYASAILGEHYEHFVVAVATTPHECEVEYDNSFSAIGLLKTCEKIVDANLDPTTKDEDAEIIWDEDEEESEE